MNWPCPVTGGAITRMGRASFDRACKARRDKNNNTCKACRGREAHWPPELELIDMASKNKETVADVIGPLKEKAEILDRVAGILGWQPDDDMVEAARRTIGALDAAVLDLRGEKARVAELENAYEAQERLLQDLAKDVDDNAARADECAREVVRLQAELAEARRIIADQAGEVSAARRERGDMLDVGAAVYRDALADFGASVLAGRVLVTFRDAP